MNTYIVSYQTALTGKRLTALHTAIQSYTAWGRINENTWAVVTDNTAVQIRNNLFPLLNPNDRIMVIRSGTEAAWGNAIASIDWLKTNL